MLPMPYEYPSSIAERVANGVALLNKTYPFWYCKLDLTTLALGDPNVCVLGQLFSSSYKYGYTSGLRKLNINGKEVVYGFNAGDNNYGWLTRTWKKKIKELRESNPCPSVEE